MGFQLNSVAANVTFTGDVTASLPQPSASQTIINAGTAGFADTGTTIYSVPAGKTFYCTGLNVFSGAAVVNIQIQADGTRVFSTRQNSAVGNSGLVASGGVIFSCAAEKNITLVHDGGAGTTGAVIWGYYVTA